MFFPKEMFTVCVFKIIKPLNLFNGNTFEYLNDNNCNEITLVTIQSYNKDSVSRLRTGLVHTLSSESQGVILEQLQKTTIIVFFIKNTISKIYGIAERSNKKAPFLHRRAM